MVQSNLIAGDHVECSGKYSYADIGGTIEGFYVVDQQQKQQEIIILLSQMKDILVVHIHHMDQQYMKVIFNTMDHIHVIKQQ